MPERPTCMHDWVQCNRWATRCFAILQHGNAALTARLPPVDLPDPGQVSRLRLVPHSALFFADSGERLSA